MDNGKRLYGVKLDEVITPIKIRDAIIQCFYEADSDVLENMFQISDFQSDQEKEDAKYKHVLILIKKFFNDIDGDFHSPTKESLIAVIDKCAEYALRFRKKEIIEKHHNEIMMLINKIETD